MTNSNPILAKAFLDLFNAIPLDDGYNDKGDFLRQSCVDGFVDGLCLVCAKSNVGEPSRSYDPTLTFEFCDGSVLCIANKRQASYPAYAYIPM